MKMTGYKTGHWGRFSDKETTVVCELEDKETVEDVIKEFEIKDKYMMWEERAEIIKVTNKYTIMGDTYEGNIVVVRGVSPYLD